MDAYCIPHPASETALEVTRTLMPLLDARFAELRTGIDAVVAATNSNSAKIADLEQRQAESKETQQQTHLELQNQKLLIQAMQEKVDNLENRGSRNNLHFLEWALADASPPPQGTQECPTPTQLNFFILERQWTEFASEKEESGHKEEIKLPTITSDAFLHVQQLRKQQLKEFCLHHPELSRLESMQTAEHLLSTMTVNNKLQMVYCMAEGTGIDTWDKLLELVKMKDEVTIETPVIDFYKPNASLAPSQQNGYNLTMVEHVLRSYTKVIFVREPFERLVSAYSQGLAEDLTFDEFVEDVLSAVDASEDGRGPIVSLCQPCFIKYDFIVTHDSLTPEVFHLMKRMGLPDHVLRPEFSDAQSRITRKWLTKNLFKGLTTEQAQQLSEAYSADFEAFSFHTSLLLRYSPGRSK
ncbi:carbohydrate sulfotransferase 11-like [Pelodytes ibericus]